MSKNLTVYFSAGGTTADLARKISAAAGGDLYEIRPQVPYTPADLDWMNEKSRSSVEMADKSFRPAMVMDGGPDLDGVETVFLGFPIWWYVAPTIINTFLETYDLSAKKIVLFATSGSSGFGNTVKELRVSTKADLIETKVLHGTVSADAAMKLVRDYL